MFIIYAIIIFAILIFVHELGHFITARSTGIRVREFALGMGPKILSRQRGETLYSLRVFPIGGFCAMEGEDEDSDDPRAFNNRPLPARALVLFAGSLMNILLAILLLSIVIFVDGEPVPVVKDITEGSPAITDGLLLEDRVLSINGEAIDSWNDLSDIITAINAGANTARGDTENSANDGATSNAAGATEDGATATENPDAYPEFLPIKLTVRGADGTERVIDTAMRRSDDDGRYRIGILPKFTHSPLYALKSIGYGAAATWDMTKMMYHVIGQLFTGQVGLNALQGPVGIVKTVGDVAQYGFVYVLQLAALISLNLGIVNLLPLPALDGGRILFLIIRLFTGKRISDNVEGKIHLAGLLLLFALMIYITVIDVTRLVQ